MRKLFYIPLFFLFSHLGFAQDIIFIGDDGLQVTVNQAEDNFPGEGQNTHFGDVAVTNSFTRTYTIKNVSGRFFPLFISNPSLRGTAPDDFSVSNVANGVLFNNQETTFTVTFSPLSQGVKDAIVDVGVLFGSTNSFNVRGVGMMADLVVYQKSGTEIESNNTSSIDNGTDYGIVSIGNQKTNSFVLTNEGNQPLTLDFDSSNSTIPSEFLSSPAFSIFPLTLEANESQQFDVSYTPLDENEDTAIIQLITNDPDDNPYILNLIGNGTTASASNEIMITQYYDNGNNDFIEIKNISQNAIPASTYYLCEYGRNRNLTRVPNNNVIIPELQVGEVFVTDGFNIRGNEIFVISSVIDNTCYNNRVDVIGEKSTWGSSMSLSKGSCSSQEAHLYYDSSDWIELTIDEVDGALSLQNKSLGHFTKDAIDWNGTSWSASSLPDRTREVVINGNYSGNLGDIEACKLTINADLNFNSNSTNSVIVYGDLTINGSFVLGDNESLVMYDNTATIIGEITKIEHANPYNTRHNNTYWSSSVINANLGSTFNNVTSSRIFKIDPKNINPLYSENPKYEHWWQASGQMEIGRGYSVEGPSGISYPNGVHIVNFTGTPNNGNIRVEIVENNGNSGDNNNDYNLIGNPYPSAIDADGLIQENQNIITGTIYLWNHADGPDVDGVYVESDYISYNLSGSNNSDIPSGYSIASGQGFVVEATESGDFNFDNTMRVIGNNDAFYKSTTTKKTTEQKKNERDRVWLELRNPSGISKEILIGFFDQATDSIDVGYDGLENTISDMKFYSILKNKKYAIQGLSKHLPKKSIDLGMDLNKNEELSIGISKLEGELVNSKIVLEDHFLNTTHDLKEGEYVFLQNETGSILNRFTLNFENTFQDKIELIESEEFFMNWDDDDLYIEASQIVKRSIIYNIEGKKLEEYIPNEQKYFMNTSNLKTGSVYIIHLILKDGSIVSKKTIKH